MTMLLVLCAYAAIAVLARVGAGRLGRRVFLLCLLAPLGALVALAPAMVSAFQGEATTASFPWAPGLGLMIDLRLDAFGAVMVLLVAGIGALVQLYAYGYFSDGREGLGRFAAQLTLFAGAMLGLVLSDDLLLVFAFWELTSVTSYLLIGTDDHRASARSAALQAFLTTGLGGLAMLGGFVMIGVQAGTYSLSGLIAAPPSGPVVNAALVLILLGAFTKSAQVPFHAWLPGAMAAPTPVSAYLHSATMVKAGVYLVARLSPAFADAAPWVPLVVTVGLVTMVVGGWRALRQHDLKLILAYGTVSQLGFLMVLFGAGTPETMLAGTAMLFAHGLFKAALFTTVGVIDHTTHTRDIRRLSGLFRVMPATAVAGTLAAASMAGLPPLLGFIGKEAALESLLHAGLGGWLVVAVVVFASVLTTAYSARFVWGAFATKRGAERAEDTIDPATLHGPGAAFATSGIVLAAASLLLGVVASVASRIVIPAARSLDPRIETSYLSLWHGVNLPLLLSAGVLVAGALAWVFRGHVARAQRWVPYVTDAGTAYQASVNGVLQFADRVTGVVQNGSLPIYLGVIVTTALLAPGLALRRMEFPQGGVVFAETPRQALIGLLIAAAAVVTTVLHRRFAAVLTLGAVGYGVAGLFVIQGAPDLALTQLLVETLVLVLFVLVLRHLPEDFRPRRWGLGQAPRIAIAVGVGLFTGGIALVATLAQREVSVSEEIIRRALPEASGRNVVNTILVDFRGFDTMGEIVVLAVASLGVMALVRAARRDQPRRPRTAVYNPYRPSTVLDTGVRSVFRTLVLFSIYLLMVGHNAPGGGFIGGLVAGCALVLVSISRGPGALQRVAPVGAERLLGAGIFLALVSAAASWFTEGIFLGHVKWTYSLPILGDGYVLTTLPFDIGVYLVVIGLVLGMLRSLGREEVWSP